MRKMLNATRRIRLRNMREASYQNLSEILPVAGALHIAERGRERFWPRAWSHGGGELRFLEELTPLWVFFAPLSIFCLPYLDTMSSRGYGYG